MMKKSGVKKMQMGGMTDRRAANAAKRQAGFEARMAADKARRQPGKDAFKARMEAARARRAARGGMKAGGGVKKYAEGGSVYRKAADGIATKGKTRGMEVRMAKGGKC